MEDKNKDTLERAIKNLQQYEPKPIVWGQLSSQLDVENSQQNLEASLSGLPTYEPSENVWNAIAHDLQGPTADSDKSNSTKWLSLGLLLISLGGCYAFWLYSKGGHSEISSDEEVPVYSFYEEEKEVEFELRTDKDEAVFAEIEAILEGPLYNEEDPEWQEWKMEWEELAFAKKEIEKVLTGFNDNEDLYVKMVSIERSQTDLTKRILRSI